MALGSGGPRKLMQMITALEGHKLYRNPSLYQNPSHITITISFRNSFPLELTPVLFVPLFGFHFLTENFIQKLIQLQTLPLLSTLPLERSRWADGPFTSPSLRAFRPREEVHEHQGAPTMWQGGLHLDTRSRDGTIQKHEE